MIHLGQKIIIQYKTAFVVAIIHMNDKRLDLRPVKCQRL
jgi:hypothetical protein